MIGDVSKIIVNLIAVRPFLKITILDGEVATSCVKQLKLQSRRTFRFNAARGTSVFVVAKYSCSNFCLFLSCFILNCCSVAVAT